MFAFCMTLLYGTAAEAEGNTEFHVKNQTGKAGDIITVPVQFNTGQEVGGFQISVYYDSDVMEYQSLEPGDLINDSIQAGGGIFDYNHLEESSEIIVVYVVPETVKDEGAIVNIQFKLKKDCGESLPIGVGVDQLVDSSDDNNALKGTVTGVDSAFQEKVMDQRKDDTSTIIGSGSAEEDDTSDSNVSDEGSDVQENDEETSEPAEENDVKAEDDTEPAESGNAELSGETDVDKEKPAEQGMMIPVAIGVIAVIAILVTVILAKRRKNRENRDSHKE